MQATDPCITDDLIVCAHLPRSEHAPSLARSYAAIAATQLNGDAEDLLLVVTELVTNAFKHTTGAISMYLSCSNGLWHVDVVDECPDVCPVVPSADVPDVDHDAVCGRGLLIVACLAVEVDVRVVAASKFVSAAVEFKECA